MEKSDSEKQQSDKSSSNRLVKILVVVFIGIPVLVELMTLFNLINVNIWGEEPDAVNPKTQTTEVRHFVEGDTLFADEEYPLLIDAMRIKVSAQHWQFDLALSPLSRAFEETVEVAIDSLRLRSGKNFNTNKVFFTVGSESEASQIQGSWELPSGDIPTEMFISMKFPTGDTTKVDDRQVMLGNLPVRYTRANN